MSAILSRIHNSTLYRQYISKVPTILWSLVFAAVLFYIMIEFARMPVKPAHAFVENKAPVSTGFHAATPSAVEMASKTETSGSPFGHTLEEAKIEQYYPPHPVSTEIKHRLRNVVPAKMWGSMLLYHALEK